MSVDEQRAPRGRKRDDSRDGAILDAALEVLAERGYGDLTVDLVAARAGAGKATVYRRWASKTDLVLDAVRRLDRGSAVHDDIPDTGSLRGDFLTLLVPEADGTAEFRLRVMAGVTAMLAESDAVAAAARAVVAEPWALAARTILERGVVRGEVDPGADLERLAWVIPSMALYRVCIERQPIPNDWVLGILDTVVLPAAATTRTATVRRSPAPPSPRSRRS